MNRQEEINNFLLYFASIYKQNPSLRITSDTFYYALMQYDIYDKDDISIKDLFPKWIESFNTSSSINVYHSDKQKHFLQFSSRIPNSMKTYKLYLSFPKAQIYNAVNIIFNFIEENNMLTYSKVADIVRSDAIVLRMADENDTNKLINFINSHPFLQNYSLHTNPFLMRSGIVGYSYDDMLSYNDTVSTILAYYFNDLRDNNCLDKASLSNFNSYIQTFYNQINNNELFQQKFLNNQHIDYRRFNNDTNLALQNYKEIIYLINQSLYKDMPLNEYFQFVSNCKHRQDCFKTNPKELLDEYIQYAIKKYGIHGCINHLNHYLNGHINGITHDHDFRQRFSTSLTPSIIKMITNNDINNYIVTLNKTNNSEKYNLFIMTCFATYSKYGYDQLYNAINNALKGNYKGFTNDDQNQFRNKMINIIKPEEISYFIKYFCNLSPNEQINIDYFCEQLISKLEIKNY